MLIAIALKKFIKKYSKKEDYIDFMLENEMIVLFDKVLSHFFLDTIK